VTRGAEYVRGYFATRFVASAYSKYKAESAGDSSVEAKAIRLYFEYHLGRVLRDYMLSGAASQRDVTLLLQTAVRLVFSIALCRDRAEIADANDIEVNSELLYHRRGVSAMIGATLGHREHATLGISMVLGDTASESVPVLDTTIVLRAYQLEKLESEPRVLDYIAHAYERCVPVTLDYRIRVVVAEQDRTFRLNGDGKLLPRLGLTSSLGRDDTGTAEH